MLLGEDGSSRVGWVVHDDRLGPLIDQRLHVLQVHHRASLHVQAISSVLDAVRAAEGHIQRKAGGGDQDVITGISDCLDGQLKGVRGSRCEDDVVSGERGVLVRVSLDDGLSCLQESDARAVPVVLVGGGRLDEGSGGHFAGRQLAGERGIAEVELDKGLLGIGRNGESVDNLADRVDGVLGVEGDGQRIPVDDLFNADGGLLNKLLLISCSSRVSLDSYL